MFSYNVLRLRMGICLPDHSVFSEAAFGAELRTGRHLFSAVGAEDSCTVEFVEPRRFKIHLECSTYGATFALGQFVEQINQSE